MKLIRPQPTYDVSGVPLYGTVRFTPGSTKSLNSHEAMEFSRESGGFLQSLGHAIVARFAFHDDTKATRRGLDGGAAQLLHNIHSLDGSNEYQKTSTVSVKYHDGNGWRSAFMELPDEKASFELVNAGYQKHKNNQELVMPCSDPLVAKLIGLAQDAGRVCPVFNVRTSRLATNQSNGRSEYGRDKGIIAVVGNAEIAELNAAYLQKIKRVHGFLYDLTESEVKRELKGKKGEALIRPVGLGGISCNYIDGIYAVNSIISGRARGEVHDAGEVPQGLKVLEQRILGK